jgi:hypothetical protein
MDPYRIWGTYQSEERTLRDEAAVCRTGKQTEPGVTHLVTSVDPSMVTGGGQKTKV